jgi:hypothetical protein
VLCFLWSTDWICEHYLDELRRKRVKWIFKPFEYVYFPRDFEESHEQSVVTISWVKVRTLDLRYMDEAGDLNFRRRLFFGKNVISRKSYSFFLKCSNALYEVYIWSSFRCEVGRLFIIHGLRAAYGKYFHWLSILITRSTVEWRKNDKDFFPVFSFWIIDFWNCLVRNAESSCFSLQKIRAVAPNHLSRSFSGEEVTRSVPPCFPLLVPAPSPVANSLS